MLDSIFQSHRVCVSYWTLIRSLGRLKTQCYNLILMCCHGRRCSEGWVGIGGQQKIKDIKENSTGNRAAAFKYGQTRCYKLQINKHLNLITFIK